jgi:hypothetical protein
MVFLIALALPTVGLISSTDSGADVDWLSYFMSVGSMMFCGIFCIGRANRYLLLTMVVVVLTNFLLVSYLDLVLPLSGYLRLLIFPFSSYATYLIIINRNVLTMKLNRIKNGKDSTFKSLLNKVSERDFPTRETNFSLIMVWYAKAFVAIDLLFVFVSLIYYNVIGMGFFEMYGSYLATGEYYNFPMMRDFITVLFELPMIITMIVHVLYDGKRPDTLGLGKTAIYDRSLTQNK